MFRVGHLPFKYRWNIISLMPSQIIRESHRQSVASKHSNSPIKQSSLIDITCYTSIGGIQYNLNRRSQTTSFRLTTSRPPSFITPQKQPTQLTTHHYTTTHRRLYRITTKYTVIFSIYAHQHREQYRILQKNSRSPINLWECGERYFADGLQRYPSLMPSPLFHRLERVYNSDDQKQTGRIIRANRPSSLVRCEMRIWKRK